MNHPTYETLIDFIEGRLGESDRAQMDAHLALPCQECSRKVSQLRIVLETMAADRTSSPSPEVLNRAIAAFKERPARESRSPLRVLAELLFDSRLQLSPAAARGAAHTRQMLFATPTVDIDLNITPEHEDHNLAGQILEREQAREPGDEHPAAFVTLQDEAGSFVSGVEADPMGQFAFRQVPSGVYELLAEIGGEEIAITGIALGSDNG